LGPEDLDSSLAVGGRGHAAEDDDGELEALGGVDGHHADGVGVGFGEDCFGDSGGLFALVCCPGEVGAEAAVFDLRPGAGLVHDEADAAPGVAGSGAGGGDFEDTAVGDDLAEDLAGGEPAGGVVGLAEPLHGFPDGVDKEVVGDGGSEGEGAAGALPGEEVVVAAAEER
jgi:hypothetical protein